MVAKRCIVTGKVQGVWFRGSTQREARRLGLTGQARNLADGSVEVIVCGEPAAVDTLVAWLQHGPPSAEVVAVVVSEWTGVVPLEFSVG